MIIFPAVVIEDKIREIETEVIGDVVTYFIFPFTLFSLTMMIFISCVLNKISNSITQPIIDLFKNVQTIINTHQSEKEELIKMQQHKGEYDE